MAEFKFPTEEIELPSKGKLYPKDNPLSSGKVEMKYMTAKEEDILTNQSFIQKGIVLDKLLASLIVNKDIKLDDLIVGDKNALLVGSRILGYGKDYEITFGGNQYVVDLTTLENKPFDSDSIEQGKNEFSFKLPSIDREINGLKKINKSASPELTTRLKHMILSVDGKDDKKEIRDFVDNYFLARDSRAFREHIKNSQPDVDLNYVLESGEEVTVPIGLNFFWPDA